ncbi:hypothetical protein GGS23DRAFT_99366 [Durotheca rogersii]|uniref:uncharacterized protein n=1 Tax=Durotheca rogersii TaxID=419775 RepID=UPI00221F6C11|nr:uncharacterized protein GGS23DRAFT_99366 [Durotheca rogersii]KAI5862411.1 hypothetical protein GGS23DRAFT_99366 [Durotheca rogersii]
MSAPAASCSSSASAPPPISNAPSSSFPVPDTPVPIPPVLAPNNAANSSNTAKSSHLPPSLSSSSPRPRQSHSASASTSAGSAASPPTTASAATTSGTAGAGDAAHPPPPRTATTTQRHIDEARAAVVASMSNMLDSELQSRASLLHANAAALTKQERDVERATDGLRRENDKLQKLARDTERRIKELGNVQNWAEVLERDFLVLEETMRLVREGSGSDSCSQCSRSSWSGSDSRPGSRQGNTADGGVRMRRGAGVVTDEAITALISEAMATDLHEALRLGPPALELVLDAGLRSAQQAPTSLAKGKAPAVDDRMNLETYRAPEPSSPPNASTPQPEAAVERTATADTIENPTRDPDPLAVTG